MNEREHRTWRQRLFKTDWPGTHPPTLICGIAVHLPVKESPYEMVIEYCALQAGERERIMGQDALREAAIEFNLRWRDAPRFRT